MSAPKGGAEESVAEDAAEAELVGSRQTVTSNFSWMLFGNVIAAASNWLTIAVIARLATPDVVGEYAYAIAWSQPLVMLSQLNLRSLQATDAAERKPFHRYFTLRLACSAICLVMLGLLCLLLRPAGDAAAVILIMGASMCFDSMSDVIYGLLQQEERMKVIGISLALKGSCSLLGLGGALFLTHQLVWGAGASAMASAIVLGLYDLRNIREAREANDSRKAGSMIALDKQQIAPLLVLAKSAVPMGLVMMLCSVTTSIPRLAVAKFLGNRELGIFAAMMSIIGVGRIVMNALGQAATPRMARHLAAGDERKFYAVFRALLMVGCGLSLAAPIGAYLIGEEVIVVIYGPAYRGVRTILTWCMVAGAISYLASFVGYAITAARIFAAQLHLLILVCVVGFAASWVLVPTAGLTGAAWAFALAMAVQAIGSWVLLKTKLSNLIAGAGTGG